MVDQDARKVTHSQIDSERLAEDEVLHDYEGNRYSVNTDYVAKQLEQRQHSTEKEIALEAVKRLLHEDVNELSSRQKDVMIGLMQGKTVRRIAKDLDLHFTTVQEHIKVAKEKLEKLINQTKEVIINGTVNVDQTDTDSKESNK